VSDSARPLQSNFSIPETARDLGISERQIWKLLAAEEIRSFKIGKRRLIPRTEIQRFVDRKMAEAA
jgi:excisionase family DNA binding protein